MLVEVTEWMGKKHVTHDIHKVENAARSILGSTASSRP